jgi:hypothetical protein
MLSLEEFVAYCGLAAIQGILVVLPRPARSARWSRLRSPGWALVLPAALMVGTFGVLEFPHGATWLAALAAVATPVLVGMAVIGVVRGPRRVWLAAVAVLAVGLTLHSWPAMLAATALTALGCLALGTVLVRLTPLPWLAIGIVAMCVVDVALLGTGVGQPAAGQLEDALSNSPLPEFHRAQLGSMNRDYPDLVLSGILGTVLAGNARQLTAGVLVAVLAAANGVFFLVADMLPATVPLGVAAALIFALERWRRARTTMAAPRVAIAEDQAHERRRRGLPRRHPGGGPSGRRQDPVHAAGRSHRGAAGALGNEHRRLWHLPLPL